MLRGLLRHLHQACDRILGQGGSDALLGQGGDDWIDGGDDSDVLQGGLGRDTLKGGEGNDAIYGSSSGGFELNANAPTRQHPILLGAGNNWFYEAEGVDGDGFQQRYLSGFVQRDQQAGDAGNLIDGGNGDDFIAAGSGADIVDGGAGSDDILGMGGNDILFGGAERDRIYGDGPAAAGANSVVKTAAESHGYDVIDGGAGNDLLLGQGKDDIVLGGSGDDVLYGDDRDDTNTPLTEHGNDYLDGGAGEDTLHGNRGDDRLIGGADKDLLMGGEGRDIYIYNRGDGIDTIIDKKADANILRFGEGIRSQDITLRLGSLLLDLGNGDAIHLENVIAEDASGITYGFDPNDVRNNVAIASFEFADGTTLTANELLARGFDLDGSEGDDAIIEDSGWPFGMRESRRWRHGEQRLRAANNNEWRRSA